MAITSSFANLATVTRASKKTDAGGWDFTNGGTVGTLTEYASGVAANHATAGLRVETSSSNEITNPRFEGWTVGADAGSREPSGFLCRADSTAGISPGTNVNAIGSENGWNYIEIEFDNSSGASASWYMRFEPSNTIAAAVDEDWTFSCGFELVSGSLSGAVIDLDLLQHAGASFLSSLGGTNFASSIDSAHRRFFKSFTLTEATADNIVPEIGMTVPAGAVFTIRFYVPQCENLAFPTSPILPTVASPAVSTRAADDIVVPNGSWSNDNGAGSVFAEFAFTYDGQASTYPRVLGYGADASNRLDVYRDQGGEALYAVLTDGGTEQASITTSTAAAATTKRVAVAWDANDVALSVSGGTQQTDTSASVTLGASALQIGAGAGGSNGAAGIYIKDLRYFPRRLSNAELEALVGN